MSTTNGKRIANIVLLLLLCVCVCLCGGEGESFLKKKIKNMPKKSKRDRLLGDGTL